MNRAAKLRFVIIAFAAAMATSVLIGDEVRGFLDGMVAGFTDAT